MEIGRRRTGSRSKTFYVGRANRNLKNRLVLRDGQGTDKLNIICMNRLGSVSAGSCEVAFQEGGCGVHG